MKKLFLIVILLFIWISSAPGQGSTSFPSGIDSGLTIPRHADNTQTFLTAPMSDEILITFDVQSTTNFPTNCIVQIGNELLWVEVFDSNTLRADVRGYGNTLPAAHPARSTVRVVMTAAHINGSQGAVIAIETKLGTGSSTPATNKVFWSWSSSSTKWATLAAGSGITITPDGGTNTITIAASGGSGGVDAAADGSTKGIATFTASDFNASSGVLSIDYTNAQAASSSQKGFLTSSDWTTFNNKFTLPSLTSGSVLFSNGTTIAQDNSNLFWDDSNDRLNIGQNSGYTAKLGILPTSNSEYGIVVQAKSGQTANLQEWRDSGGAARTTITSGGVLTTGQGFYLSGSAAFYASGGNNYLMYPGSPNSWIQARGAAHIVLVIQGTSSQTANLQEWQNNSSSVLASVSAAGTIFGSAFTLGSSVTWTKGSGAPAGVCVHGSLYSRTDASGGVTPNPGLYICEEGSWVAK